MADRIPPPPRPRDEATMHSEAQALKRLYERPVAKQQQPPTDLPQYASTKWSFGQVADTESDASWSRLLECDGLAWPSTITMDSGGGGEFYYPSFIEHRVAVGMAAIEPKNSFGDVNPGRFIIPVAGLYRVDVALAIYPHAELDYWAAGARIRMRQDGFAFLSDGVPVGGPDFSGYPPVYTGDDVSTVFPTEDHEADSADLDMSVSTSEVVWCGAGTELRPMYVATGFHNCSYPADGGFELGGHSTVTFVAPWARI